MSPMGHSLTLIRHITPLKWSRVISQVEVETISGSIAQGRIPSTRGAGRAPTKCVPLSLPVLLHGKAYRPQQPTSKQQLSTHLTTSGVCGPSAVVLVRHAVYTGGQQPSSVQCAAPCPRANFDPPKQQTNC